jgi:hypothetical protein
VRLPLARAETRRPRRTGWRFDDMARWSHPVGRRSLRSAKFTRGIVEPAPVACR